MGQLGSFWDPLADSLGPLGIPWRLQASRFGIFDQILRILIFVKVDFLGFWGDVWGYVWKICGDVLDWFSYSFGVFLGWFFRPFWWDDGKRL